MGDPYLRGTPPDRTRATCKSCRAPIRWLPTRKGNKMPVDARPSTDPSANVVICDDGVVEVLGPMDPRWATSTPRYVSHFRSCPHADQHRRPAKGRRP